MPPRKIGLVTLCSSRPSFIQPRFAPSSTSGLISAAAISTTPTAINAPLSSPTSLCHQARTQANSSAMPPTTKPKRLLEAASTACSRENSSCRPSAIPDRLYRLYCKTNYLGPWGRAAHRFYLGGCRQANPRKCGTICVGTALERLSAHASHSSVHERADVRCRDLFSAFIEYQPLDFVADVAAIIDVRDVRQADDQHAAAIWRHRHFDALLHGMEVKRILLIRAVRLADRDTHLPDPAQPLLDQRLVAVVERLVAAYEQGSRFLWIKRRHQLLTDLLGPVFGRAIRRHAH